MATTVDAPRNRSLSDDDRVRGLVFVAAMAAVMWVVEVIDAAGAHLDANGIHPRDPGTLPDIAFAPFLHAGWGHLIGNTIPFLVLGAAIALSGLARVAAVTAIVAVIGGFGTWLIGPADTNHIGASGLVFGFAAYLVARGIFSRRPLHLARGRALTVIKSEGKKNLGFLASFIKVHRRIESAGQENDRRTF